MEGRKAERQKGRKAGGQNCEPLLAKEVQGRWMGLHINHAFGVPIQ